MRCSIPVKLTPMSWFVILLVIAAALVLGLPPDPATVHELHTTTVAYKLAVVTLLIPYAVIWYAAFYAFAKLQEYSSTLGNTKDGRAFRQITVGMGALAFSLIVPMIIVLVLDNIAAHNPGFKTAGSIINNYLGLFPGLVAFLLLKNGTRVLIRTASGGWSRMIDLRWHAPWFLLLGVVFTYLTIKDQPAYHLSAPLLIMTIIVPYLYSWVLGMLAAFDLRIYAQHVRGSLYRRAVKWLSHGIAVAIAGSIAIQFVNAVLNRSGNHSLLLALMLDYLLLIVLIIGLALIALGTRRLRRIEEV